VLQAAGHLFAAEQCHDESASILKHWIETKDRDLEYQLAFSLRARGHVRQTLGQALRDRQRLRGAVRDFTDVIGFEKSRPANEWTARNLAEVEQARTQALDFLDRQFP
jgi:hypothetical protein